MGKSKLHIYLSFDVIETQELNIFLLSDDKPYKDLLAIIVILLCFYPIHTTIRSLKIKEN